VAPGKFGVPYVLDRGEHSDGKGRRMDRKGGWDYFCRNAQSSCLCLRGGGGFREMGGGKGELGNPAGGGRSELYPRFIREGSSTEGSGEKDTEEEKNEGRCKRAELVHRPASTGKIGENVPTSPQRGDGPLWPHLRCCRDDGPGERREGLKDNEGGRHVARGGRPHLRLLSKESSSCRQRVGVALTLGRK